MLIYVYTQLKDSRSPDIYADKHRYLHKFRKIENETLILFNR